MTASVMSRSTYLAVIVLLLFSAAVLHGGPQHGLLLLSFCVLVAWLWLATSIVKLEFKNVRSAKGWLPALALAYLIWLLVSPFFSTYPYASFGAAMQLALLPLALLGWLLVPDTDKDQAWATTWRLLLVCGAILAAWGVIDFSLLRQRAHGPLIDANAYAALVNLFLIPLTFSYLSRPEVPSSRESWRQLCVIALLATAQFMSLSRGGLIALLAVLPVVLWSSRHSPSFRFRSLRIMTVLSSAYLIVNAFSIDPNRSVEALLLGPKLIETDTATQARLLIWKSTWEIIRDSNVFIGTGLGTFTNYYVAYRYPEEANSAGFYAHNDYLQALQEGGIVQLAFLLSLTVLAPVVLFFRGRKVDRNQFSTGLVLAIAGIALHATVNFIQFMAPISILAGLYLARSWESGGAQPGSGIFSFCTARLIVKPNFAKGLAIALLGLPVLLLILDGAIFRIFDANGTILSRMDPAHRFSLLNMAMALRPANPVPRVAYIRDLLRASEGAKSPIERDRLLSQVEREADLLSARAPALPSGRYFRGVARAMKGSPASLALARDDLEYVVKRVPPATQMRLTLIRVYRALGLNDAAYRTVLDSKQWLVLERDKQALTALASEAIVLALGRKDQDEADFWAWVHQQMALALSR